ncbi:hypothetical protein QQ045_030810 [Rhodiola kirilowii]
MKLRLSSPKLHFKRYQPLLQGFHLAKTSVESVHPTFALVRDSAFSQSKKLQKLQTFTDAGVRIAKGSLQDEEKLMEAVKLVDVVICAVAAKHALDQKLLIRVIKQAGCIKRFVPSEFGINAYNASSAPLTATSSVPVIPGSIPFHQTSFLPKILISLHEFTTSSFQCFHSLLAI